MTFVKTETSEHSDLSDNELISLIIGEGKKELLEIIYDRYVNKVYYKTLTLVNDQELAKDLTHDILVKVMLNLSKFKMKGPFSLWIHSITYNYCMDYLRKKKRLKTDVVEAEYFTALPADDTELEHKMLKEMRINQLENLLRQLTAEERLIMMMRYKDGFSIQKIATTLNLNEGAVKMRLKRCRGKMVKLLKESNYEE